MNPRFYTSTDAALAAICTSDDVAAAAYLFNGDRPTVIRVLREEEQYGGGYLLIIEDDGLGVNRKHFRTIDDLVLLLAPESDSPPIMRRYAKWSTPLRSLLLRIPSGTPMQPFIMANRNEKRRKEIAVFRHKPPDSQTLGLNLENQKLTQMFHQPSCDVSVTRALAPH